ncbi:MarR family winged helix-turn-helix transcriptional regulator [Kitasatospora brasiliensis]|uniref:MarR family winged helix-turn-helix transcriptional regulator n=1 Tax=Kitasatospora brasiliensis TaxID=3058040 RepID=UPI0029307F61|nr:MarR family transcriptional regulator [Kitasatospora sp. K002]
MDEKLSNAPVLTEGAVALPVIDRLLRVSRQAELRFGRTCSRFGLQAWEFDVLTTLRTKSPVHEMCPGTIADRLLISNSTMTNRVNRLEKAGLVERRLSPENRRIVIVRLTDKGREVVDQVIAARKQTEREVLGSGLSEEEAGQLSALLGKLDTALVTHES